MSNPIPLSMEKTRPKTTGRLLAATALSVLMLSFAGTAQATDSGLIGNLTNTTLGTVNSATSNLSLTDHGGSLGGSALSGVTGTVGDLTSSIGNTANLNGVLNTEDHSGNMVVSTVDTVSTAAGDVLAVNLDGDNLVSFEADKETARAVAKLDNSATVSSQRLALNEAQADSVLNASVNLSGVDQAKSASVDSSGAIILGN